MDTTQQLGLGAIVLWALVKFWPQLKEKLTLLQGETKAAADPEAVQALVAAQTLQRYLAGRSGCKRSLEALGTLTLGNFLPVPPAASTSASSPAAGERKIAMEVRHYNLNVPIDKDPVDAAVEVAPIVAHHVAVTPVAAPAPQAPAAAQ